MLYEIKLIIELRKDGDALFKCPFCYTKYLKNNKPAKNALNLIHKINLC